MSKTPPEKGMPNLSDFSDRLFGISDDIRYIALYRDGRLEMSSRPGLKGASSPESDTYEEIIVNPTLLTLLRQRGDIDCGGVEYVIIRYGNFLQTVHPIRGGHLSIALEPTSPYERLLPKIRSMVKKIL
jgi:hypothetical protein